MSSRERVRQRNGGGICPSPTATAGQTDEDARYVATQLCTGFVEHDRRHGTACREAFAEVDRYQFPHLTDEEAVRAATAYVAALWEKDAVEEPYVDDGRVVDSAGLAAADWSRVRDWLELRAETVGMGREYAAETTEAWKRHKVGGDYWTPTMAAQRRELEAALRTDAYPNKPRAGADGFGHLATRYLTGVELHDMRSEDHWSAAVDVMTEYFAALFARQGGAE